MLRFFLLTATVAAIALGFCPRNSAQSGSRDKCFAFYNFPMKFDDADTFCYNLGGRLASLTNAFEASAVAGLIKSQGSSANLYWIGARSTNGKPFFWLDGTPFSYTNWDSDNCEPKLECATGQLANGKWATSSCGALLPFACALDPAPPICDSTWAWFQPKNACYKVIRDFTSFTDADQHCRSLGANLTSIRDRTENDWVYELGTANYKLDATDHDVQTWIGLKRNYKGGSWYWTDGTPFSYSTWTKDEPADDHDDQNCVEIYTDTATFLGDENLKNWNNVKCNNDKRNAVCRKPVNK